MNKIKAWLLDHWLEILYWLIVAIIVLLLAAAAASRNTLNERVDELEERLTSIEAVHTADCSKCDHLKHECHHGEIDKREFWCQAWAACETGCSSDTINAAPPQPDRAQAAGAMPGEGAGGDHLSHSHGPKCPCNVCPWNCLDEQAPVGVTGDEAAAIDCDIVRSYIDDIGADVLEYVPSPQAEADTKLLGELRSQVGCTP